ncbi:tail fiber assembly protein [Yersinia sp. IP36721]|uniref:tail fiber assembly protein n=1 Tax=Yersinia sp. IP36721 TaxID=2161716 RepID=UPI000EB5C776|nr:tail fiber assembly protein [Yersinia sp. IP36721]
MTYFSESTGGFYPQEWKDEYLAANNWPSDAILLTKSECAKYWKQSPPAGMTLHAKSGRPVWIDIPPPRPLTMEELVAAAEAKKNLLMSTATQEMAPLQDAIELNIASESEVTHLTAWKTYRVLLNRVDTATAPDIDWPEAPADVA